MQPIRGRRATGALAARIVSVLAATAASSASGQPEPAEAPVGAADVIVVTASRTERALREASAATTVIGAAEIESSAADDYGDLLRAVPGLNVAQTSARDVSVATRGASSTLANSELALVDGRSLYLDFFDFVAWDLLPLQPREIERIEVVRGPGSTAWGANALGGVVNVITKRPRDIVGTTGTLGSNRAELLHAAATDQFEYKIAASYYEQSAYPRPTGEVPGSNPPQTYPAFENDDTEQSRLNFSLGWDLDRSGSVFVGAGRAETSGILHSGIGPFDIENGSSLSYAEARWENDVWRIAAAATYLDGNGVNLLTRRADGAPLSFAFVSDTYDLDASGSSAVGSRHTLTYGADLRSNDFTLEIAPRASSRRHWSLFLQDEIELGSRLHLLIGSRYYEDDALDGAALAPRASLVFAPSQRHSFRASYGESFRTPSAINEYLDVTILQAAGPLFIPGVAEGNLALNEERLEAYEIGYAGSYGKDLLLTVSAYRNEISDSIDFFVADTYGPANLPAPGPGLPDAVIPCFAFAPGTGPAACPYGGLAGLVPSDYTYRNVGKLVNRGIEVALNGSGDGGFGWYVNVSRQQRPDVGGGIDAADINIPPKWRANLGVMRDAGRRFWSAAVNHQDEAYWADVLFARAPTEAFTQLNAAAGWRFLDDRLTLKISVQNLTDEDVQQHIFGDFLERRFETQLSYEFRARD